MLNFMGQKIQTSRAILKNVQEKFDMLQHFLVKYTKHAHGA